MEDWEKYIHKNYKKAKFVSLNGTNCVFILGYNENKYINFLYLKLNKNLNKIACFRFARYYYNGSNLIFTETKEYNNNHLHLNILLNNKEIRVTSTLFSNNTKSDIEISEKIIKRENRIRKLKSIL